MRRSLKSLFSINTVSITFGTILLTIILFLTGTPIFDMIELKTYDLRFLSRGSRKPSPTVVLALVDEKSLDQEGRWPWPRFKIARLVDILSQAGAKVIGFDIGFLEPDENTPLHYGERLNKEVNALRVNDDGPTEFINDAKKPASSDLVLANSFKKSSAAIILGYFFHMNEADLDYHLTQKQIERQLKQISAFEYPFILYQNQFRKISPFLRAYMPESSPEILSGAADWCGYYNVKSDQDGVVRSMPLIIQCNEEIFPPLALSCAWFYLDKPQLTVMVANYGVEGIRMGNRLIPTDERGFTLIDYLGPPKTFPHYSISDILRGEIPKRTFKDKIVLVGATAMGTYDLRSTPVSPLYPGVEVNATVIDNILTGNFITKPNWTKVYDLFAIIILGVITGLVLPRVDAVKGMFFLAGMIILQIYVSRSIFINHRIWLNIVYPLLVLFMTYTALTGYRFFREERERKRVKSTFGHYVSPIVIEEMLKEPQALKLGGEERVLTVLFSDLQDFTSYSEQYQPHEMIDILSDYYDKMTEQIFGYQGTLIDYIADELVAIFGAPLNQSDHAQRACVAALAMRQNLQSLSHEWAAMGRPYLKARTGINTGSMLVGNLGSSYRFTYGILGAQANLGSRIEGLNKVYGTEILIGENTARLIDRNFILREIDLVRVVGMEKPVRIYELLAKSDAALAEEKEHLLQFYASGLKSYWLQDWHNALEYFERCLLSLPDDGPSQIMANRCRLYMSNPPSKVWDGVFEPLTK